MPDRRQKKCTTAEEIAQAKIDALKLREGDPGMDEVLRAMLENLQERFGEEAQQASAAVVEEETEEPFSESGQEELDEQLKTLVVDAIDARYPDGIEVKGKKRTGEEIARAIPDVEAFLAEVNLQRENGILLDFFELNDAGQLVMKDDCSEAYGRGENALEARIRQTRVVYRDADAQTQVMTGEEYFTVTRKTNDGMPLEMKVSEKALSIDKDSILMKRGLPTLQWTGQKYVGEYARMNNGQLEIQTYTWVDDKDLSKPKGGDDPRQPDFSRARVAGWSRNPGRVSSTVFPSYYQIDLRGSRGVIGVYWLCEDLSHPPSILPISCV